MLVVAYLETLSFEKRKTGGLSAHTEKHQVMGKLIKHNHESKKEKERDTNLAKQPTINNRELLLRDCQC